MAQEPPASVNVFISYAREDLKMAKRLYADLKQAGVSPWLDAEDLLPGQKWRVIINAVIKESSYVIALLSSRSLSKRGYVQKELKKALDVVDELPPSDIFVIPVRIDDCQPIDERLQDLHWVDLFPSYDEGLRQILRVLVREDIHREETVGKPADAERDDQTGAPGRDITAGKDYFEHIEGPAQIFTGPVYIQQGTPKPEVEKQGKAEEPPKAEEDLQTEKPAEKEKTKPRKARVWRNVALGVVALMLLIVGAVRLYQVFFLPEEWTDPVTGMEFVKIPAGCFQMGSPETEVGRGSDESPVHKVCVDGFWMGKYEVTNAQYRKWETDHDSLDYEGHSLNENDQPVVLVSWEDANAFAAWLTEQHGGKETFRLPTEAEWEYAARAGTTTARFWGDNPDNACQYANVYDQTSKQIFKVEWEAHNCDDKYAMSAPVGRFGPNAFGLHDMLGNIWEWCLDWYEGDYYAESPKENPQGPASGSRRVLRGGSWSNGTESCGSARRGNGVPGYRHDNVGFRLVRTVL